MRNAKPKLKTAPTAGPLKAYFDRVNRLEDDAQAVRDAVNDLTKEIKGTGYNAKAIKRMVKAARRKTDEETEADIEIYTALLGEPGATYRSVSEKTKVPRSTLHRLVPRAKNGTETPRDAGGVITEPGSAPVAASEKEVPGASLTTGEDYGLDAIEVRGAAAGDATHERSGGRDEGCREDCGLRDGRDKRAESGCREEGNEGARRRPQEESQAPLTDAMGAKASRPEPVLTITDEATMTAMEAARERFMAIR